MADSVDEVGAIERKKVKRRHTAIDKPKDLLGREGCGCQSVRFAIKLQSFKPPRQP
jgi:hypothetical protein